MFIGSKIKLDPPKKEERVKEKIKWVFQGTTVRSNKVVFSI